MIWWRKIRGHDLMPYKVIHTTQPWRWQCTCGKVFGIPKLKPKL